MQLTDALLDLSKSTPRPIIAIDGRAGAGKTTFAELISSSLSGKYSVATIHLDNLYNGWSSPFDHHLSDALLNACESHTSGKAIELSHFSWDENRFSSPVQYPKTDLLIIEGVGALARFLRPFYTATLWIDIDVESGKSRVLQRDGDISAPFIEEWIAAQEKHFDEEGSRDAADFIIALEI